MIFGSFINLIDTIARNWNPEIEHEIRDCVDRLFPWHAAEYYIETGAAKKRAFWSYKFKQMSYTFTQIPPYTTPDICYTTFASEP
jgi:hypothetical protein